MRKRASLFQFKWFWPFSSFFLAASIHFHLSTFCICVGLCIVISFFYFTFYFIFLYFIQWFFDDFSSTMNKLNFKSKGRSNSNSKKIKEKRRTGRMKKIRYFTISRVIKYKIKCYVLVRFFIFAFLGNVTLKVKMSSKKQQQKKNG